MPTYSPSNDSPGVSQARKSKTGVGQVCSIVLNDARRSAIHVNDTPAVRRVSGLAPIQRPSSRGEKLCNSTSALTKLGESGTLIASKGMKEGEVLMGRLHSLQKSMRGSRDSGLRLGHCVRWTASIRNRAQLSSLDFADCQINPQVLPDFRRNGLRYLPTYSVFALPKERSVPV